MDANKNYENLQKILKSLKQYKVEYIIPDLYECLIAIDPAYKKVFAQSVITEISGIKAKGGRFEMFKVKSPKETSSKDGNGKDKESPVKEPKEKKNPDEPREFKERSLSQDMSNKLNSAKESLKLSSRTKKNEAGSPRSSTAGK